MSDNRNNMKEQVLEKIYDIFERWAASQPAACAKGCSVCCSQNVTITALEGERILRHVQAKGREKWLADKLVRGDHRPHRPAMTTNGFAGACLNEQHVTPEEATPFAACPFLEDRLCAIYPVRPFGCRCFLSSATCTPSQPAVVANSYFAAATVVQQLIEHLGQGEYWGNMLDVLPALLDGAAYQSIARCLDTPAYSTQARLHTLTALPLPGLLLTEEDRNAVTPLLGDIFQATIEGKTIEDFLNGR